jgi:hypothetical protein
MELVLAGLTSPSAPSAPRGLSLRKAFFFWRNKS